MQEYNLDERYFGYHLEYYFRLIDVRRSIEASVSKISEAGKNILEAEDDLCKKLHDYPIEIPSLYYDGINEVTGRIQSILEQIATNVNKRWELIKLNNHVFFSYPENAKENMAPEFDAYNVNYSLPTVDNFDDAEKVALPILTDFNLIASEKYHINSELYLKPRAFSLGVHFSSKAKAISCTKRYLLEHNK